MGVAPRCSIHPLALYSKAVHIAWQVIGQRDAMDDSYLQPENASVVNRRSNSDGIWRVGNVGLLLIEAAKQGSRDHLEFLFNLPQG